MSNPFFLSYMSLLMLLPLCGMLASPPMKISHPWRSSSQPCLTLCNPMDCSPPGSSVHGALQARILEWVAILFSRHPWVSRSPLRISVSSELVQFSSVQFSSVAQSCPTLCNPFDSSLPGSSLHGALQARILERVAISFSMEPKKNDTNELIYKRNT